MGPPKKTIVKGSSTAASSTEASSTAASSTEASSTEASSSSTEVVCANALLEMSDALDEMSPSALEFLSDCTSALSIIRRNAASTFEPVAATSIAPATITTSIAPTTIALAVAVASAFEEGELGIIPRNAASTSEPVAATSIAPATITTSIAPPTIALAVAVASAFEEGELVAVLERIGIGPSGFFRTSEPTPIAPLATASPVAALATSKPVAPLATASPLAALATATSVAANPEPHKFLFGIVSIPRDYIATSYEAGGSSYSIAKARKEGRVCKSQGERAAFFRTPFYLSYLKGFDLMPRYQISSDIDNVLAVSLRLSAMCGWVLKEIRLLPPINFRFLTNGKPAPRPSREVC